MAFSPRDGANWAAMNPSKPRSARGGEVADLGRRAVWGALLGAAISIALAALDASLTGRNITVLGLLAVVPFLASTVSTPSGTFLAGAIAAATTALMGDYARANWSRPLLALLAGIAASTLIATMTAGLRSRRLRQLRHSRAVADVVQTALLRPVPDTLQDVRLAAHYSSATHGAQVGGDVYEILTTPYGVRAFVGDVRGKGLPAVHLASATLGAFREWAYQAPTLAELAAQLDASVARNADAEEFVTAVLVQLDQHDAEIINCGHPAPLLLTSEEVRSLEPAIASLPFGLGVTATVQRVRFVSGDRLLLYTDGVTDARRRGKYFDVATEVSRLPEAEPDDFVRSLHRRLVKFTRRHLSDDVAILLLERKGSLVAQQASPSILEQAMR
ncbi:MAG TPA: PP2C family protein-serine/threonine phosphatase [Mycobacteriales bacterium]|nr:PP2C family protein-serine/threonine phosphatase [Mycobacteriales bacterium]